MLSHWPHCFGAAVIVAVTGAHGSVRVVVGAYLSSYFWQKGSARSAGRSLRIVSAWYTSELKDAVAMDKKRVRKKKIGKVILTVQEA